MGLFKKKDATQQVEEKSVDKFELLRKEKENMPMTYQEVQALSAIKKRELTDKILSVAGLLTILFVIVLAVSTFLYPYSLFNLFGGDTFVDCLSHLQIHVPLKEPWIYGERELLPAGEDNWITIHEVYNVYGGYAFLKGAPAIITLYVLGSWAIVPLATIGLVGIIIAAIYILTIKIKDLIIVIRHFRNKVKYVATDIVQTGVTSVELANQESAPEKPKKSTTKKKTAKKETEITKELVIAEEPEEDYTAKLEEYKKELEAEEKQSESIQVIKTKDDLSQMSDDDLDRLLGK